MRTPLLLGGLVILALGLRFSAFPFESLDFELSLKPWYDYLVKHGRFASLKDRFSDYAPPYLYLLSLSTYLPIKKVYAIKAIATVFDLLLAFGFFRIVSRQWTSPAIRFAAVALPLFWPTVLMNNAVWGQCDVTYTALIVLALGACLASRWHVTAVFLGLAFSMKLQTLFALPAFGLVFLKQRAPLKALLWIPLMYLVSLIPAWLAGRPLVSLLSIYQGQAGGYSELSLGAPNMLQVFWGAQFGIFKYFGMWFAVASVFGLAAICAYSDRRLRPQGVVLLLLSSALLCPFFLPLMHERYYFLADVISILYVFWFPRRWWVAAQITCASFFCYLPFLFNADVIGRQYLTVAMGVSILVVLKDLISEMYRAREGLDDGATARHPSA